VVVEEICTCTPVGVELNICMASLVVVVETCTYRPVEEETCTCKQMVEEMSICMASLVEGVVNYNGKEEEVSILVVVENGNSKA
jgi:hypothetical protein